MGMYGWTKRKLKNGKDRVKRRTKAVGRWVRKNREDIAEEVTETVLDVDSPMPSSSSHWGQGRPVDVPSD